MNKITFDAVIGYLLKDEAGYQCDPDDAGNWTGGEKGKGELKGTKYGISAASYPDEDIVNLTMERAAFIYKRDYWPLVSSLPDRLRYALFDFTVNAGTKAIKLLQRLAVVKDDGIVGPKTIAASSSISLNQYTLARKAYHRTRAGAPMERGDERFISALKGLVTPKASQRKFLNGWLDRAERVQTISSRLLTQS